MDPLHDQTIPPPTEKEMEKIQAWAESHSRGNEEIIHLGNESISPQTFANLITEGDVRALRLLARARRLGLENVF